MKALIRQFSFLIIIILTASYSFPGHDDSNNRYITDQTLGKVRLELVKKYGEQNKERIFKGTNQVARNWRESDGTNEEFEKFCQANFLADTLLAQNFKRIEGNLEIQNGYLSKIRFRFNESSDFTDTKEVKVDQYFRKSIPALDPYEGKLAFFIQLNFPHYSLDEKRQNMDKLEQGKMGNGSTR